MLRKSITPSNVLVLTNDIYVFCPPDKMNDPFEIKLRINYGNTAQISVLSSGFLYIKFLPGSGLSSRERVEFVGSGVIPDEVMRDRHLQMECAHDRQTFINYISALIFGHICTKNHCSLDGAMVVTLDEIFFCQEREGKILIENNERVFQKLMRKLNPIDRNKVLRNAETHMQSIEKFVESFCTLDNKCQNIDIKMCVTLNYQASILHRDQFPAASLILNISALESLIEEIFFFIGAVEGSRVSGKYKEIQQAAISSSKFRDMTLKNRIYYLSEKQIIDRYLAQRTEECRFARNRFSHRGHPVRQEMSGKCQTVLRDYWKLILEDPFELMSGFSYRL